AMRPSYGMCRGVGAMSMEAIACVDSAMWDALGKALAAPLFKIWGGFRHVLPIIAIGGYYGITAEELAAQMEGYRTLGLAGCKLKVGGATPEGDARRGRD